MHNVWVYLSNVCLPGWTVTQAELFFIITCWKNVFSSKKKNMQQLDLSDFIGETEENQWNWFGNVGDASHYLEKTAPPSVINLLTLFFRNQSYSCCDCPGTPRTSEILSFLKRLRLHSQFDWTLVCLLGNSDLFAEVWTQSEQRTNSLLPKKKRMSSPAASAGHRQKHNLNNSMRSMLPSITVDEQGFFSIIASDSLFITVAAPPLVRSGI